VKEMIQTMVRAKYDSDPVKAWKETQKKILVCIVLAVVDSVVKVSRVCWQAKCCDEAETARTECGHQGVVRRQLQKTEAPDRHSLSHRRPI